MSTEIISQFSAILKQLATIVATLATLVGPAAGSAPHFGGYLPTNINATTTLPSMVSQVPYFQTFDSLSGVYTVASSSIAQNSNNISVSTSTGYGLLNVASSTSGANVFTIGNNGAVITGASSTPSVGCYGFVPKGTTTVMYIGIATTTTANSSGAGSWFWTIGATSTAPSLCN